MASKLDNLFAASRFVLPEHREAYLQLKEDQKLVPQPVLEDDELMELSYRIQDCRQYDYAVSIKWWSHVKGDLGEYREMWGWVQRIDTNYKQIKLVNDEDFIWIDMDNIVGVQS